MSEERVSIFIVAREAASRVFNRLRGDVQKTRDEMGRFTSQGQSRIRQFATRVQASLQRVSGAFQRLRSRISGLGLSLGGLSLGLVTKKLFELGTAAEETRSKFLTVYRGMQADAGAFADEFGRRTGQTRQEAEELLATTGAVAQGFGFQRTAALELTKQIGNLGADLASFNNLQGGTAEGIDIINRTLTGEFERAKSVGIVIRALEVDQRALAKTGKSTVDALTEQERVMARLELFTERAGVAVGDLDRTFDSVANTSRRVFGQLRQVAENLGIIFVELVGGGFEGLDVRLERFNASLETNRSRIVAWAKVVFQSVDLMVKAFGALFRVAFEVGQAIGHYMEGAFSLAIGGIIRAIQTLGEEVLQAINKYVIRPANNVIRAINFALPEAFEISEIAELDEKIQSLDRTSSALLQNGRQNMAGIAQSVREGISAVTNLADEWRDVRDAAEAAREAQENASRAITGAGDRSYAQRREEAAGDIQALLEGLVPTVVDRLGREFQGGELVGVRGAGPAGTEEADLAIAERRKGEIADAFKFEAEELREMKASFLAPFLDLARDFIESTRSELDELQDTQVALRVAFDTGRVTAEEYSSAMEALNVAMKEAREGTKKTALDFARLAPVLANAIAQIIQGLQGGGGGGFFGALSKGLGIAAGIASVIPGGQAIGAGLAVGSMLSGALASRGGEEVPVSVSRYGDRALQQMREASGPEKVTVQIISPTTGELLDETIYEIDRRSRIDHIVRIPRTVGG